MLTSTKALNPYNSAAKNGIMTIKSSMKSSGESNFCQILLVLIE